MALAPLDEIGSPGDDAGLRTAESLSPLKVTSAAPSASVCTAAGSSASHAGGAPGSHGQVASSRPLPMSATTGTPSVASSATDVSSTKPSTR
jgi:hypothetical protein